MPDLRVFLQALTSSLLLFSSLGILVRKPIHASLFFLLSLLLLAALYFQLSAPFIAVMQILVYAGAILVLFVFVMILFQDAHEQIETVKTQSSFYLRLLALLSMVGGFSSLVYFFLSTSFAATLPEANFGSVKNLGKFLYIDYFFPFEAVALFFLLALIGVFYMGQKEKI